MEIICRVVIDGILAEIDKDITEGTLLTNFKMSALPVLHSKFVELTEYLVRRKPSIKTGAFMSNEAIFEVLTARFGGGADKGRQIFTKICCQEASGYV